MSYDHVYLSPHLDDAAFSCGGTIALQRARGERVLVVTLCTGDPSKDDPIAGFADEQAREKGMRPIDVARARRREDERAMTILDAEFEWKDQLDIGYRWRPPVDSFLAIFGADIRNDDPLIDAACDVARKIAPGALIYAPLGVGRHVDHRIVHAAARAAERPILYYEDFPYVTDRPDALEQRLREIGAPFQPIVNNVAAHLERRMAASLAYETQVGKLGEELGRRMWSHALAVGNGAPAERFWALA